MSDETTAIRLLFVDDGSYRHETIRIPSGSLEGYERLIDCLREDPAVLGRVYVDVDRLCSAAVMEEEDDDGEDED